MVDTIRRLFSIVAFAVYNLQRYLIKTVSVLIYSYIITSRNRENEKLCGNTTPVRRSVFIKFRVFLISTSVDITAYHYEKNVLNFL